MTTSSMTNVNDNNFTTLSAVETTAQSSGDTTMLTIERENEIKSPYRVAPTWFDLTQRPGHVSSEC